MYQDSLNSLEQEIKQYASQVPERIWEYLIKERGLSKAIIQRYEIGWDGERIMMPVKNKEGKYLYCKQRKDPVEQNDSPKYCFPKGVEAELFGRESIKDNIDYLVVAEGEFDCLCLIDRGIPAVSSTAGANTFKNDWIEEIKHIPTIYVCFDTDEAGLKAAENLTRRLPHARAVKLPDMQTFNGKDITDYFVKGKGDVESFKKLLTDSQSHIEDKNNSFAAGLTIVEKVVRVQLALDFVTDKAILTLPFPTKDEEDGKIKDRYWIITSKKEMYPLNEDTLLRLGIYSNNKCFIIDNRWDYEHIKKWIKGEVKSDPKKLFERVIAQFRKYLDYRDERMYAVVSLWSIGTYLFPKFDSYAILFLHGPSGTGKSKTIKIIEFIGFNAINSSNMSDSGLFRLVEGGQATLLLDENEMLNDPNRASQLSLILSAFNKQGKVVRVEKGRDSEFIPTLYNVYSPKVIANIAGSVSEALKNRSIYCIMTPTQNTSVANVYPVATDPIWQTLRNELYVFMMEEWESVMSVSSTLSAHMLGLTGYDFMIWEPILTLAKYFENCTGMALLDTVVSLATEKTKERKLDRLSERGHVLLATLRRMIQDKIGLREVREDKAEFYATKDIRRVYALELELDEGSDAYKKLSPDYVGRQMRKFDAGEMNLVRTKGENNPVRGIWIKLSHFNETLSRFGLDLILEDDRSKLPINIEDIVSGVADTSNREYH